MGKNDLEEAAVGTAACLHLSASAASTFAKTGLLTFQGWEVQAVCGQLGRQEW